MVHKMFSLEDLKTILHPTRMTILKLLNRCEGAGFTELLRALSFTMNQCGLLSYHLKRLYVNGLIAESGVDTPPT